MTTAFLRCNRGFTLLEIIMVIAIMSILAASVAPQMIKSKSDEIFLIKAQQEIEARQNAARWYYNDYGVWPTIAQLKAPTPNTFNPTGSPYLNPSCSEASPFATSYVISSTITAFTVSVNVPSDLANRLMARLTSPSVSGSGATLTVTSSVPRPGNELVAKNFQDIKYISMNNNGDIVTQPTCYSGATPYIDVLPANFVTGASGQPMTGFTSWATDNGNGTWTVYGQVRGSDNVLYSDSSSIKLQVIVVCR